MESGQQEEASHLVCQIKQVSLRMLPGRALQASLDTVDLDTVECPDCGWIENVIRRNVNVYAVPLWINEPTENSSSDPSGSSPKRAGLLEAETGWHNRTAGRLRPAGVRLSAVKRWDSKTRANVLPTTCRARAVLKTHIRHCWLGLTDCKWTVGLTQANFVLQNSFRV